MSDRDAVRDYYASFGEREWLRLERAEGAVEWELTTRRIARHLEAESRVLDIGGGPGRYAIWLAAQGHTVTLADLSAGLLDIARGKITEAGVDDRIEAIVEADACDLSAWRDGEFDAALSLGPFYHLPDAEERVRAAAELARVLRPGGVVFVAFMTRLALLGRTISIPDERHQLLDEGWLEALMERGEFVNDVPGRFNGGYGARPEEVRPFMEASGFETISLSGAQSFSGGLAQAIADVTEGGGALSTRTIDLLDELAEEPSILGASSHLLYVGRRG